MHKIDTSGHVLNRFSDGNPLTGQQATLVDAAFANALMDEIVNVIQHAGIPLAKGTNNQLRDAIIALISGGGSAVTAAGVSVADVGSYFDGANVEDVIQQIGSQLFLGLIGTFRLRRNIAIHSGAANNMLADHFEDVVEISHATATTYTILNDATLPSAIGVTVTVFQAGAGKVEVVAGSGVTLLKPASFNAKTMEQHAAMVLVKVAANTWRVGGTLEAAA